MAKVALFCERIPTFAQKNFPIITKLHITMKTKSLLTLIVMLLALCVKADELQVVTSPVDGGFAIAGSTVSDKAIILYDDKDAEVVLTVIDCLMSDLKAVTKKTFLKYKAEPTSLKNPIIVGTIGQSSHIDQLIADGKIDVSDVEGKWEAFGMQVIDNPMEGVAKALVIFGAQPRGTAYGMFHLSRMIGVSPWIWWADVTPATKTQLYVTPGRYVSGTPSVKFRGIFLNDEDYGLRPWAAKKMDTNLNNFGPKTYAAIMELLLRLRANTLWPAMHAGSRAFWFEKTNIPLIMKYDIYMGSSHCEQMLRDNEYVSVSSQCSYCESSHQKNLFHTVFITFNLSYSFLGFRNLPFIHFRFRGAKVEGLDETAKYYAKKHIYYRLIEQFCSQIV